MVNGYHVHRGHKGSSSYLMGFTLHIQLHSCKGDPLQLAGSKTDLMCGSLIHWGSHFSGVKE